MSSARRWVLADVTYFDTSAITSHVSGSGVSKCEPTPEALLEEFREAGHAHRLHLSLMFGQITVYLAGSGALFYAVTDSLSNTATRFAGLFGLLLSFVFLVHHERVYAYSHGARQTAIEAQKALRLTLYKHHPSHLRFLQVSANSASRLLYGLTGLMWVYVAIRGSSAF